MPEAPHVRVAPGQFSTKAEVLAEIARDDLWPLTLHQGAFPAAPVHRHDAPVRIYVLAGALLVKGGRTLPFVAAAAGTRVDIPAGAPHTVCSEGPVVTINAFAAAADTAGLPPLPAPEDA